MATAVVDQLRIAQPFTFPCGTTIRNRLVKSAMIEGYTTKNLPFEKYNKNYARWAQGGFGMLITGNWMVDPENLSGPGAFPLVDPHQPRETQVAHLRAFAAAAQGPDRSTKVLVQLCHPGRASMRGPMGGHKSWSSGSIAPSAIPMPLGPGFISRAMSVLLFGTPREMTREDIELITQYFVDAAKLAAEAGLDGVELHGAHGYLLSQFLSEDMNKRTDEFGGDAVARTTFVTKIIRAVREAVPKGFVLGIKLNSVDYQSGRNGGKVVEEEVRLKDCIAQFGQIAQAGVDFVEVSGGTYADPVMASGPPQSARTQAREAFFLTFAETFRASYPDVPLMVTGGFRSRKGMEDAVAGGGTDLVGIGRAAVLSPSLPKDLIFSPNVPDEEAVVVVEKYTSPWYMSWAPNMVGVGLENSFYNGKIKQLGIGDEKVE